MRLIRNQGSNVTPQDDARLFSKLFSTGFWNSPAITSLGSNQVKIQSIRGMILGRDFEIEETTMNVALPTSGTGNGMIVLRVNIANEAAPLNYVSYLKPHTLIQEDFNESGSIYEYPIAEYSADPLKVSSIATTYQMISVLGSVQYAPGFIIPANSTWTQLTAENVASLDPDYLTAYPKMTCPWFIDVSYACQESDTIEPMWTDAVEGLGTFIKVTKNKLRIYASADLNGTELVAFKCRKG